MERKSSFKDRAFDKLGISSIRAKAHSFDIQILSDIRSVTTSLVNPLTTITDDNVPSTNRPRSMTDVPDNLTTPNSPMVQERKVSRPQPPGTISHVVDFSETIHSIAVHYDITPSELAKINRLTSRTIFPGQTLFVPGEDYVSAQSVSPPGHSPTQKADPFVRKVELPMVQMQEKPPPKIPGRAERLSPILPAPPVPEAPPPDDQAMRRQALHRRLTDAEARSLDQECHERFIKVNVKYITDGQGVIEGTLLVTPNALMFDPNVSDPLVIEKGSERFGMIAPMDTVISATLYHDIAAMNRKRSHDPTDQPKHEVYYGSGVGNKRATTQIDGTAEKSRHDDVFPERIVLKADSRDAGDVGDPADLRRGIESHDSYDTSMEIVNISEIVSLMKKEQRLFSQLAFTADTNVQLPDQAVDEAECTQPDDARVGEQLPDEIVPKPGDVTDEPVNEQPDKPVNEQPDKPVDESNKATSESIDIDRRADTIVLDVSDESKNAVPDTNIFNFDNVGKTKIDSADDSNLTPNSGRSSGVFSSSIGSLTNSPHINTFVNYATGLFRNTSDDRSIVKDITDVASKLTKIPDAIQTGSSTLLTGGSNLLSSLIPDSLTSGHKAAQKQVVAMQNAVKLDDCPDLFQSFNELIPKPARQYYDPPLYLNIHVGEPINRLPCSTCVIEAYGKKKKKPEYWFSIPRDKVDQLYAFFVQWTPDKYGDADDFDPTERGFVVISDDKADDNSLELFNDYFGESSPRVQRDWEIVSHRELLRRQSTFEPLPRPDLIGTSVVLTDEDVDLICPFLPARAVGYAWTQVYSSEKHGFSLKTLYRMMRRLDCPVILAVKDNNSNVFGALASVPLKVSEHFYGTGESFLYQCTPEFKLYRWTGQNNFFIKGNVTSLAIGAGRGIFGLWFDSDLYHGCSHPCDTFDNDILSGTEDFVVQTLEAWAFIDT